MCFTTFPKTEKGDENKTFNSVFSDEFPGRMCYMYLHVNFDKFFTTHHNNQEEFSF